MKIEFMFESRMALIKELPFSFEELSLKLKDFIPKDFDLKKMQQKKFKKKPRSISEGRYFPVRFDKAVYTVFEEKGKQCNGYCNMLFLEPGMETKILKEHIRRLLKIIFPDEKELIVHLL